MAAFDGGPPAAPPRVLIVMDKMLANFLGYTLRHGGYQTKATADHAECRSLIATWEPDLAFVDLDLHGACTELLGSAKPAGVPLVVFTRKREAATKIGAFKGGADDVVMIPLVLGEILARSYALIRRVHSVTVPFVPRIRFDSLEVDLATQGIRVDGGKELHLTPVEATMLYLLAASAGEIVSRKDLVSCVWDGVIEIESNAVDRHVRDLRVKLGDTWPSSRFIETIAGKGYRYKLHPPRPPTTE